MSLILAIDQSTSATKAIIFNASGKVLAKASQNHRQIYPRPGWVEHDAEEIWRNVQATVRELSRQNPRLISRVAALSLTNQRETVVVFDRQTGRPLHPALVWLDRRGDALCQRLRKQKQEPFVHRQTGLKIDTYFSASKLRWLVENHPGLASKLKRGDALVGTIDAYLVYRLTGGRVFATDFTNASRTLLFDIKKLRWDESLCRLFKVSPAALPEVRESSAQFGTTSVQGALPGEIPIRGVMGDSQAALFAQRCFQPGMAKATFGTGTSVLLNVGHQFTPGPASLVTALAWVHQGQPTYAVEGLINFSAATIDWLKNQAGLIQTTDEAEKLAIRVPDNGGVYLVPAFAGLSAPHWNPDARAAFIGMSAFTRREHIARAAEESIAYQIRDVLDFLRSRTGVRLTTLQADGGPTRDKFLMQFTADLTGCHLRVAAVAEASAWGAALNGLLGLGVYPSLKSLAKTPASVRSYRRKMPAGQVQKLYAGWCAAVRRVL